MTETSVPSAAQLLRDNSAALQSWLRSFDEQTSEDQFWGRFGLEQKIHALFELTRRTNDSLVAALEVTAQGIETRSAETERLSPKGEIPVPQECAQVLSANPYPKGNNDGR